MTTPAFVALDFPPWLRWGQRRGAFIDNEALAAVYPDHKRHVRYREGDEGAFRFVLVGTVRRCGWCGETCKGRRTAWCSGACADRFYRVWSWGAVRTYVRDRDANTCQRCCEVDPGFAPKGKGLRRWEVDHILPVKDGGTDDPQNLRLLCSDCHVTVGYEQRATRSARTQPTLNLEGAA